MLIVRLLAALAATLVLSLFAARLELSSELVRLLPAHSPTARAFSLLVEEFSSAETVFVAVRPRVPPNASGASGASETSAARGAPVAENDLLAAAWALEERLADSPLVAEVRSGLTDEDEAFLLQRVVPYGALLLEEQSFAEVMLEATSSEALRQRAQLIRRQVLSEGAAPWLLIARSDPLGLSDTLLAAGGTPVAVGGLPTHPLTGSFLSEDGDVALLIVEPGELVAQGRGAQRFLASLEEAIVETRAALGNDLASRLEFLSVGGPVYAAEDERAVRGNLVLTVGSSALGCLLVLWSVFGGWRVPVVVLASVATGLVWLFGFLSLAGASLSALGLGFAAVLVGLGVDYGIHAATVYREELRSAVSGAAAWSSTRHRLRGPIWASAATTAGAFSLLLFAELRLLRDVGLVVSAGILAVGLATWVVGGSLLQLLMPDASALTVRGASGSPWFGVLGRQARAWCLRHPVWLLAFILLCVICAIPGIGRSRLQTDLQDLRPGGGLSEAEEVVARAFGLGSETATLVVSGRNEDEVLQRASAAARELRAHLPAGAELLTPSDFLRSREVQRQRLERLTPFSLGEVAAQLRTELRQAGLDPAGFAVGLEALEEMSRGDAGQFLARPPRWLERSLVRRSDGTFSIALQLRLPKGQWREGPPSSLTRSLAAVAPGAAWASFTLLARELENAAAHDLATLAPLAALLVLLLVTASLPRRPLLAATAVLPVAVSTLVLLGIWGWFSWPLDLVSIVVLPIVLGIGIDDGLHVVHAAAARRDRRSGNAAGDGSWLAEAVSAVARPITVTTITTCIGFGSLALSNLEALRRAGLLVVLGVLLCWLVTLALFTGLGGLRRRAT